MSDFQGQTVQNDQRWPLTYPPPSFEKFALEAEPTLTRSQLQELINETLGGRWLLHRFGDRRTDFEVSPPRGRKLSVGEAWDATYLLRARPGIRYAEPLFEAAISGRVDWNDVPIPQPGGPEGPEAAAVAGLASFFCADTPHLGASDDPEWSLKEARVLQAWQRFFFDTGLSNNPGEGIIIGHPDTGYHVHPEIQGNLLTNQGFDYVKNDSNAEDELENMGPLPSPGHGTGTASVIASPRGAPAGQNLTKAVSGIAPGARLIPFRVSRSVVLVSTSDLGDAIERATKAGAHVISISMGGPPSWRLWRAVIFAQRRGVITLAAAGNCVRFVVWPAAFDEVIAVAASNAARKTWHGSSRGGAVDVTAPGESVWHAVVNQSDAARGSGTSYAVATVAGIAALWLARHGRDQLISLYGAEKIPFIFNQILRRSCVRVNDPSWEPGNFGAGLVDAERVLAEPLPDGILQPVPSPALFMAEQPAVNGGTEGAFAHLFERYMVQGVGRGGAGSEAAPAGQETPLRRSLAQLLRSSPEEIPGRLRDVGQELAFHLATDPALYKEFASSLLRPSVAIGAEAAPAAGQVEATRSSLLARGVSQALGVRLAKADE